MNHDRLDAIFLSLSSAQAPVAIFRDRVSP